MPLTFGLLSPNKGIEHMLRAVPEITRSIPNWSTSFSGRPTRPVRTEGERYRLGLERLAAEPGHAAARHLLQPLRRAG